MIRSAILLLVLLISLPFSAPAGADGPRPPILFEQGDRFGYRRADGTIQIPARFPMAEPFSEQGLAAVVAEGGYWVLIDTRGVERLRPFVFDNGPDPFQEGLARFIDRGKIGFHDRWGRVAIAARFDFAQPFNGGIALFCTGCQKRWMGEHGFYQGGDWGAIDRRGRELFRFDEKNPPCRLDRHDRSTTAALNDCAGRFTYLRGRRPLRIHQHPIGLPPLRPGDSGPAAPRQDYLHIGEVQIVVIHPGNLSCPGPVWTAGPLRAVRLGGKKRTKDSYAGWRLTARYHGCVTKESNERNGSIPANRPSGP